MTVIALACCVVVFGWCVRQMIAAPLDTPKPEEQP